MELTNAAGAEKSHFPSLLSRLAPAALMLGAVAHPGAVGAWPPPALPKTQVFHSFSCLCCVSVKSLRRRKALQAIPAGRNASICTAPAASQGDSGVLGLHCLVLRCLQILKLSLIIAQNQRTNISCARKAPPRWAAPRSWLAGAAACRRAVHPCCQQDQNPWRGD